MPFLANFITVLELVSNSNEPVRETKNCDFSFSLRYDMLLSNHAKGGIRPKKLLVTWEIDANRQFRTKNENNHSLFRYPTKANFANAINKAIYQWNTILIEGCYDGKM